MGQLCLYWYVFIWFLLLGGVSNSERLMELCVRVLESSTDICKGDCLLHYFSNSLMPVKSSWAL